MSAHRPTSSFEFETGDVLEHRLGGRGVTHFQSVTLVTTDLDLQLFETTINTSMRLQADLESRTRARARFRARSRFLSGSRA